MVVLWNLPGNDNSADGGNTIFGPGTPLHIVVNGGGKGRKMSNQIQYPCLEDQVDVGAVVV